MKTKSNRCNTTTVSHVQRMHGDFTEKKCLDFNWFHRIRFVFSYCSLCHFVRKIFVRLKAMTCKYLSVILVIGGWWWNFLRCKANHSAVLVELQPLVAPSLARTWKVHSITVATVVLLNVPNKSLLISSTDCFQFILKLFQIQKVLTLNAQLIPNDG